MVAACTIVVAVYFDANQSINNLQVTNITDSAVTIIWNSDKSYIPVVTDEKGQMRYYDDRDVELNNQGEYLKSDRVKKRHTHHVTVRNLRPNQSYKFFLKGNVYKKALVSVETEPLNDNLVTPNPAYGKVVSADNSDSLIFFTDKISKVKQSSYLAENGTYSLDLNLWDKGIKFSNAEIRIMTKNTLSEKFKLLTDNYQPLDTIDISYLKVLGGSKINLTTNTKAQSNLPSCISSTRKSAAEACAVGNMYANPERGGCDGPGWTSAPPIGQETNDKYSLGCVSCNLFQNGYEIGQCLYKNGNGTTPACNVDNIQSVCNDTNTNNNVVNTEDIPATAPVITPEGQDSVEVITIPNTQVDTLPPGVNIDSQGNATLALTVQTPTIPQVNDTESTWRQVAISQQIDSQKCQLKMDAGGPGMCFVDDICNIHCQPKLREKDPTYTKDLLLHESWHIKQRSCRSDLPHIGFSGEWAADYASNNAGLYTFRFIYNCNGETVNTGHKKATEVVAEISKAVGVDLGAVYNCQKPLSQADKAKLDNCYIQVGQGSLAINSVNSQYLAEYKDQFKYIERVKAEESADSIESSGRYSIFVNGELAAVYDLTVEDKLKLKYFYDTNKNGIQDAGETIIDSSEVTIKKDASISKYKIDAGWNAINIPQIASGDNPVLTAGDLISYWSESGIELTKVARFTSGKFQTYTSRDIGNNFTLLPGQGIFVYSPYGGIAEFHGKDFIDNVPIFLENGWNLVGISSSSQKYSAKAMLEKLNSTNVESDTISLFENGIYKSIILEESVLFGNDYKLVNNKGYFIRVKSGGGNKFTPWYTTHLFDQKTCCFAGDGSLAW